MPAIPPMATSPLSAPVVDVLVPTGPPPIILADKLDDKTGEFLSLEEGLDPTDAAVQVTFVTQRRSGASVRNIGQRFNTLRHADDLNATESEAAVEGLAIEALRHLLDARDVRLERARGGIVEGQGDTGQATIEYKNLRTGKVVPRKVPVSA